jgi:hypothetical protein
MFSVSNKLIHEFFWVYAFISEPSSQAKSWILLFKPFWERGVADMNRLVFEDLLFSHRIVLELFKTFC